MDLRNLDVLIIENVGNMVCPATFDLGEHARIALMSVTEGEDKPLKYPTLFKRSDVVIINKIDIAQAVDFQRELALNNLRRIAPQARILEVSARSGEGMQDWYDYLGRCSARNVSFWPMFEHRHPNQRVRIIIHGAVQGVGFRPSYIDSPATSTSTDG